MISIITPVYNAEKFISSMIDSVLVQTYQDWELILVDDGSKEVLKLEKSEKPQCFKIKEKKVKSFVLDKLIKAEGESPFPALTQIEVWGVEA